MAKKKSGLIVKIILGILIVLVILVVAGLFFIDTLAKNALEKGAPLVLGTNVSVERIHIEPFNARVEITNLIVDNPQGTYSSEYAIKLGDIIADIDLNTVTKDKIRIEEMFLKDVDVVYDPSDISILTIELEGFPPCRAKPLIIQSHSAPRPKLPEHFEKTDPSGSRLLAAAEQKNEERDKVRRTAISFTGLKGGVTDV